MKGLLLLVYTVISWYLTSTTFIIPLYILSSIKPLRKTCNQLSKFITSMSMRNTSFFYQKILNIPLTLYGDSINKNDSCLFLMNHRSSIDYLFYISLISEFSDAEKIKIVMKSVLRFFPGLGWVCYVNDYPFLKRNFATDQNYLKNLGKNLNNSNLLIFPEGTRYSQEKLLKSNQYSEKNGYPKYNNLLLPKTKGSYLIFKSMLEHNNIDAIYDLTINFDGIEKCKKHNTSKLIFKNNIKSVHIHSRRISVDKIPKDEDGFRRWMHQLYIGKDLLLDLPINKWKNIYPYYKVKKRKNILIFLLVLILTTCFIYLIAKSKKFRYYHYFLFISGFIIVIFNNKYRKSQKIISNSLKQTHC